MNETEIREEKTQKILLGVEGERIKSVKTVPKITEERKGKIAYAILKSIVRKESKFIDIESI